jgi:acetyl-CoA synthetase
MQHNFQIQSLNDYHAAYKESIENPEKFWGSVANEFQWKQKWTKVVNADFRKPDVKWFQDAKLNITENCLDRHLSSKGNTPAIIWEPNDPREKSITLTYRELYNEVNQFSKVLSFNGVRKGDRVCLYMGMTPELVIALLACARIGAIHSVIFAGFSAQSVADRILDAHAEFVITADATYRGEKVISLKNTVDEALNVCPFVKKVIVNKRVGAEVSMEPGRDVWWHDEMNSQKSYGEDYPAEAMESEDPLFILYTSGSTGKPKGVVHTCAGYMVYTTYSFVNVFQYKPGDIYFCTADIGWITGHSYIVYGPLCAGATIVLFEGMPTWPDAGRLWSIVDKHKVNILYTAPTAVRTLMTFGLEPLQGKSLNSLKVLGTVGEPINSEAWFWLNHHVGKENCPIVDTWWQTETGGIMISNIAGITDAKPTYATLPLPGIVPVLIDESGQEVKDCKASGYLCLRQSWPSILRTVYGDHERCRQTYFGMYDNLYFTGDAAIRDEDGNYRITGRVDDVINVSGHRLGTAEIENAINLHPGVAESAVVGCPHEIKGQGIYAYVICHHSTKDPAQTKKEILEIVTRVIGPLARPDHIQFVSGLPKTRSGKIMRRILRKITEGEHTQLGDTSTLLNPGIVDEIINEFALVK